MSYFDDPYFSADNIAAERRLDAELQRRRGSRVGPTCECGYPAQNKDALIDHIRYMVTVVGESNAKHGERR